jgi:Fe(II)/alpha-ketoglutarate-dependent arginine beta-hydroxylase
MNRLVMHDEEIRIVKGLLGEVIAQYSSVDDQNFLEEVPVIANEIPRRLRRFLNVFRQEDLPESACVVAGYPVDDEKIGPTPDHWRTRSAVSPTLEEELLFVLFGSLLGEAIGWATQQNGYIVHDVLPIRSDEDSQLSSGSKQLIWWHNEDAFHPYRGDYVGLMCLRNPDHIPTTLASMGSVKLDPKTIASLFEPRFVIRPDESHAKKNNGNSQHLALGSNGCVEASYKRINEMQAHPEPLAVLFGDPLSPYIRVDPYFMDPPEDDVSQKAFNTLIYALNANSSEVALQPGDMLFVDNYRAVHGRKPFKAKYDGTDRWLKRINIARDLRKSRSARRAGASRVIF